MSLQRTSVIALFIAAALPPVRLLAGPVLYTMQFNTNTLYSFDAANLSSPTLIGSTGVAAEYGGLAYDTANSTMYMVSGYGSGAATISSLYTLNLATGAASLVGSLGIGYVTGLTFDSGNDTLYATQEGGPLQSLNIATGAATAIGSGLDLLDNLAYDSTSGVLYGWEDCIGCAALYTIDPSTGLATLLSNTGLSSNDSGIVYDPVTDELWDLDDNQALVTIDLSTYTQTLVGYTSAVGGEQNGLALVPASSPPPPPPPEGVPEPSTLLMPGSGLGLLAVWSARRKWRWSFGRPVFGDRRVSKRSRPRE